MANQLLTITKICGDSADVIYRKFQEWNKLRAPESDDEWESKHWPETVQNEADKLVEDIRMHCCEPPIVFYAEYVDMWSFCPPVRYLEQYQLYGIPTEQYEIFCLRLPLPALTEEMLKLEISGQHDEDKLFASIMLKSFRAWQPLVPDGGILVMIRQVVGGSVLDEEINASLKGIPSWLSTLH